VNPDPLTLRQLDWMADGRRLHDWQQTAQILCLMAEQHRDKKKRPRPFEPDDFNPMMTERDKRQKRKSRGVPIKAANIEDLKALVPEHKRPTQGKKRKE